MLHIARTSSLPGRLFKRSIGYTGVGVSTYALDLLLIALMVYVLAVPYTTAVVVGFLIAVSINFLICYHYVYRGTKRNIFLGYAIFICIAGTGAFIVMHSVRFLVEEHEVALLVARTIVAAFVGLGNFLLNTFFNFRLV